VKARVLQADGSYRRVEPARPGEPSIRSQVEFQNMARELASADPMRPAGQANASASPIRAHIPEGREESGHH